MSALDPFEIYRNALFLGLAVYGAIVLAGTVAWLVRLLAGTDEHKQLLRVYVSYQALTIRWRTLAGELAQIGLLLGALWGIYHLHAWLES